MQHFRREPFVVGSCSLLAIFGSLNSACERGASGFAFLSAVGVAWLRFLAEYELFRPIR